MVELHKVRITVLKRFLPSEVFEKSPVTSHTREACSLFNNGQEFIVENLEMPEGFCTSAWVSMYSIIQLLSFGGGPPVDQGEGRRHQLLHRRTKTSYIQTRTRLTARAF